VVVVTENNECSFTVYVLVKGFTPEFSVSFIAHCHLEAALKAKYYGALASYSVADCVSGFDKRGKSPCP
jgi:hypothetical protein